METVAIDDPGVLFCPDVYFVFPSGPIAVTIGVEVGCPLVGLVAVTVIAGDVPL